MLSALRTWWVPASYLAWIIALVIAAAFGRWDAVVVSVIGALIYLRFTWGIRRGRRKRQELRAIKDRQRKTLD
jgi:Flp pilus assembly protein TadB